MGSGGGVVSNPQQNDTPVLITEAAPSFEDQHAARKRKYATIMSMRVAMVLAAMFCYQIWWLALALLVLSVPLPWMAVLIANDRPPRKAERVNRHEADRRAIEPTGHTVIEG
ncbi:DUF3099 domain-containing protein [Umezawaea beigongshangensis]|uniref:DUF3099 domain-containing protein n=1 Tax=Umezawaea beigongshangensis TaxID=2780383 RepID=UPI0018F1200B|nr:DUF3099 domain-containing protein [Umezawaea beigongshangensis]